MRAIEPREARGGFAASRADTNQPASTRPAGRLPVLLLIGAALAAYTVRYLHMPSLPRAGELGSGWWAWWDQGEYFRAAQAWAVGDLNPALHWYFPGYSMIGALFCRLMPAHPFFLPDAAFLVIALCLFIEIGAALDVDRTKGAIIFVAAALVPPTIAEQFVIPWTTTPAMVLIAAVLLAGLRYYEAPAARWAIAAGACGGALLLFRPTDLVVLAPVAAFCAWAAARKGGSGRMLRDGAGFAAGFALLAVVAGGLYWAIHGFHESGYMRQAAGIGFDITQLPIKWVTIFLDPKPLFLDGEGILHAYPWIACGILGAVQFSLVKRSGRHALVAAVMLVYAALYLSYVDLLPANLWAFKIIHYFKWLFPFFGLFAFLALRSLGDRLNWRGFAAALAISALPLSLHVGLKPVHQVLTRSDDGRAFVLEVSAPVDAIDIPLSAAASSTMYPAYLPARRVEAGDNWILRPATDGPSHALRVDGTRLAYTRDFHIFAAPTGARIVLLHPQVGRRIEVRLAEGNILAQDAEVRAYSTSLGLGWPVWLRRDIIDMLQKFGGKADFL